MANKIRPGVLFVILLASVPASRAATVAPVFTPQGYGKNAKGGRGGRIIKVTSLEDNGPGTFREACKASGPRIVVFEVAGVITLNSGLTITKPYLTIAGQTAPGDGITLRNGPNNTSNTLKIKARDVIVQYLRIRTGDAMSFASDATDCDVDCIGLTWGAENVILDHISASWSIDETIMVYGDVTNVTVQNCLIAEALTWSKHPRSIERNQPHGCAILFGAGSGDTAGHATIHHNVMAHNCRRNPRLSCQLPVDVINNIMYNTGGDSRGILQPIVLDDGKGAGSYTIVDNYFKPGPETGSPGHFIGSLSLSNSSTRVWCSGNYVPSNVEEVGSAVKPYLVGSANIKEIDNHQTARAVYNSLLDDVGACWALNGDGSKRWRRDALDSGWIADVQNGTGSWVNTAGIIPPHDAGTVILDSDDDGMPDDYEEIYPFLDKNNPSDGNEDEDADSISNVEEFLFGTSPNDMATPIQPHRGPERRGFGLAPDYRMKAHNPAMYNLQGVKIVPDKIHANTGVYVVEEQTAKRRLPVFRQYK